MAVYNGGHYLPELLTTTRSQTFRDYEWIIVDDGSTDGTRELLRAAAGSEPRIVLIENDQNIGLAKSLNRGLDAVRGRYIARLDADDRLHPERLARQFAYLEAHPEIGILGTQMDLIDSAGQSAGVYRVSCDHDRIVWMFLFGSLIAHPTVMIRRTVIEAVGKYDPFFTCTEDIDLWVRCIGHAQFANLPDALYDYRKHPGSVSVKKADLQQAEMRQLRARWIQKQLQVTVEDALLHHLIRSQAPRTRLDQGFTEAERNACTELIFQLYHGFCSQGIIRDTPALRALLAEQVTRIARYSEAVVEPAELIRHWENRAGKMILKALRRLHLLPNGWS
jgi:hypothetical protein